MDFMNLYNSTDISAWAILQLQILSEADRIGLIDHEEYKKMIEELYKIMNITNNSLKQNIETKSN